MCLIVKEGCKIEIAEKDITTYKRIISYDDYWTGIFFFFPAFTYNKLQKAKCLIEIGLLDDIDESIINLEHLQEDRHNDDIIVINEGFHSYIKEPNHFYDKAICIIPKGSEYCLGINNDVVSNQIIVFKTKEDYDKYISSKISSN